MKILHLMPYSPEPPMFGGALRIHHLLRHFIRHHEVTLACFGGEDDYLKLRNTFGPRLQDIHVIPPPWPVRHRRLGQVYAHCTDESYFRLSCTSDDMRARIERLASANDYAIVFSEFCMMAGYEPPAGARRILDAHNVEYDNFLRISQNASSWIRKGHYYLEYGKMLKEELSACRRQDAVFVTSERDRRLLASHLLDVPQYVVPNGVDFSYFHPSSQRPEPYSLVFTGLMKYIPNYDGIIRFIDETLPIIARAEPRVKLYVVGSGPPKELQRRASDRVVVTGYVDDVRPYVWNATAYVVPLHMGGGTRLKILEAMAMKKPVVATRIGCEGIDAKNGESILLEDEPQAFAERVLELFHNAALRQSIAEHAYELARSRYEWAVIHAEIDQIFDAILHPNISQPSLLPNYHEEEALRP